MSLTLKDNLSLLNVSIESSDTWITDDTCRIFQYVVFVFAFQSISVFGVVANIINIVCFVKQGFQDSVNVNFLAMAISDTGCLVTLIFFGFGYNPSFQAMDPPFDYKEMIYLTVGWPHIIFVRVTSYITALITLERCLCITNPLKVKSAFTPQRVGIIILIIYGIVIFSVVPVYCVTWFVWKFSPEKNRTVLTLEFTRDKDRYENVTYIINMTGSCISFLIIIVCTLILVIKLQKKSKWRMNSVGSKQAQEIGKKEQKVAKMVVMISVLFIACYVPICLLMVAILSIPGLTIDGKHINLTIIIAGSGFFLESVNSSMNIFVYYSMSSKYKTIFLKLLKLQWNYL